MLALVFDVESIGLHGEGYAVGWVVVDTFTRKELEEGYSACSPSAAKGDDASRDWVSRNIPDLPRTCATPREVRDRFWGVWMEWKNKAKIFADCAWPVEARFLAACVDDFPGGRQFDGPYPLHDVASVIMMRGADPTKTYHRMRSESPAHHPTRDARQSARLLCSAMANDMVPFV